MLGLKVSKLAMVTKDVAGKEQYNKGKQRKIATRIGE